MPRQNQNQLSLTISRFGEHIFISGLPGSSGDVHANAHKAFMPVSGAGERQRVTAHIHGPHGAIISLILDTPSMRMDPLKSWVIDDARTSVEEEKRIIEFRPSDYAST